MDFSATRRPSPITGSWYCDDPDKLAQQMDAFMDEAVLKDDDIPGEIVGIIAPHAGHIYSGRTAGYAYKAVRGDARPMAVILSPYHGYSSAEFLTTSHAAYETPLGIVPVATTEMEALSRILNAKGMEITQVLRDGEHSLEIQLPFLQRAWQTDFQLMPLMLRSRDPRKLQQFASALHNILEGKQYLLIASTDLSHFHPLSEAEQMDAEMLRRIKQFDPRAVLDAEMDGSASACGAGAVAAAMWTAEKEGVNYTGILNYSTSADVTGDRSSVVGYGAALLAKCP